MTSLKLRTLFAAVLLLTLFSVPTFAQTDEPTAAPVTIEASEPTAAPDEIPTDVENVELASGDIIVNAYVLIGGAILVLMSGAGIGALATRWRTNPAEILAIEELAKSTPEPVAMGLLNLGETLAAIGELMIEAFDRIPAASKDDTANKPQ